MHRSLRKRLLPHQIDGLKWMMGHFDAGHSVVLADDMGLGKTVQAIACISELVYDPAAWQ